MRFVNRFFNGSWKHLHRHTLSEFVPRIAIYPESNSSGITHVMEGDEVEKYIKEGHN